MAKSKPKTADQPSTSTTETATAQQVTGTTADAIRALCCVTGCGSLIAQQQLDAMPPQIVQQIADAEASGNRQSVPQILQTIQQDSSDDQPAQDPDSNLHTGGQSTDSGTDPAA